MGDVIRFRQRSKPPAAPDPRTRIEGTLALALDAVDHLVAALDEIDGDPDLEDGGDAEPSLGAPEGHASQVIWLRGGDQDREQDVSPCSASPQPTGTAAGQLR